MSHRPRAAIAVGRRTGIDFKTGRNIRRLSNGLEDFEDYFNDSSRRIDQSSTKNSPEPAKPLVRIGRRTGRDFRAGKNIRRGSNGLENFSDYFTDTTDQLSSNNEVTKRSNLVVHVNSLVNSGGRTSTDGSTSPSPRAQGSPHALETGENEQLINGGSEEGITLLSQKQQKQSSQSLWTTTGLGRRKRFKPIYLQERRNYKSTSVSPFNMHASQNSLRKEEAQVNSPSECEPYSRRTPVLCSTRLDGGVLPQGVQKDFCHGVSPLNSKVEACHLRSVTETTASQQALEASLKGQQLLIQRSEQGVSSLRSAQRGAPSDTSEINRESSRNNSRREKTVASPLINRISPHSAPENVVPAKSGQMEQGDKAPSLVNDQLITGNRRRKAACPRKLKVAPKARRTTNNKNHINLDHDGRPPESELKVEKSLSQTRRSAKISLTEDEQPDRNVCGEKLLPRSATGEELPATPLMLSHTHSNPRQKETSDGSVGCTLGKQVGKQNIQQGSEASVRTRKRLLYTSGALQNAWESPEILKMHEKPSSQLVISASHSARTVCNNSSPSSSEEGQNLPGSPPQQLLPVENSPLPVENSPLPLAKQKTKGKRMNSKRKRAVKGPAVPELSHSKHQVQPRRSTQLNKTNQPNPAKQNRKCVKDTPVSSPKNQPELRRGTRTRQPPPPRNGLYRPVYEYTKDGPVFKEHVARGTYEDPYKWAFANEIRTIKGKNTREKQATAVPNTAAVKVESGKAHSKQKNRKPPDSELLVRRAGDVKFQQQDETGGQYEVATQYMLKSCHTGLVRIPPGQAKQVSDTYHNNIIFTALDYPVRLTTVRNTWVVLSKGDACLVPKGATYSLQNLSQDHGAELHFTVVC